MVEELPFGAVSSGQQRLSLIFCLFDLDNFFCFYFSSVSFGSFPLFCCVQPNIKRTCLSL